MHTSSKTRIANGVVSALVLVLFALHALAGSLSGFLRFGNPVSWLVWAGVALAGVHVVLCVATSYEQLTDAVRPPSIHKKRHLALKWATGSVLAVCAVVHVVRIRSLGPLPAMAQPAGVLTTVALSLALACHIWTGSKSLLKDLGIDRRYRGAVRVFAVVLAALCCIAALVRLVW